MLVMAPEALSLPRPRGVFQDSVNQATLSNGDKVAESAHAKLGFAVTARECLLSSAQRLLAFRVTYSDARPQLCV
jgi:hypothetical protein